MRDVMVDLETLGQVPGCAILSIGAVAFDSISKTIADEGFYQVIYRPSCEEAYLFEQSDTQEWWSKQSPEARVVLEHAESLDTSVSLSRALELFNQFVMQYGGAREARVWGNGADFDNAILASAYEAVHMKPVWKFWNNRCYRTMKGLLPDFKIERSGTYHNALDDARSQAEHLVRIMDKLGFN